jgi:hypothetical protein
LLLAAGRGSLVASWSHAEDDPGLTSIEELTFNLKVVCSGAGLDEVDHVLGVARVGNPLDTSILIAVIALGWC